MANKIRVTIWNEYVHEVYEDAVREIYPLGIHGCIKEFLEKLDVNGELEIRLAALADPDQGLPDEVLNNTDVLMWWGHCAHHEVDDGLVQRIKARVYDGGMGFIPMHSAHMSKPFREILGTSGKLLWGEDQHEFIWNVRPGHPITAGIPEHIELDKEEMYGEPFMIPQPDELLFISWFEQGYVFRSGCTYHRGRGKIFYFQPGHEYCRSFYNEYVQRVLYNAVKWAAPNDFGCPMHNCDMRGSLV
ncbi:MAG: ThuA domain-containing protein [Clostridia bacterium]|nr:ThuA domain-containing protein [Clostridia bacterium]